MATIESQIDWYADGELADSVNLSRPIRDLIDILKNNGVLTEDLDSPIRGDNTKRFKVADAIEIDEAITKGQLLNEIKNLDYFKEKYNNVLTTNSYSASIKDDIYCDSSSNAFDITLPMYPKNFESIKIMDIKSSFETNNVTVRRNGNLIMGLNEDLVLNKNDSSIELIYINGDWRIK